MGRIVIVGLKKFWVDFDTNYFGMAKGKSF